MAAAVLAAVVVVGAIVLLATRDSGDQRAVSTSQTVAPSTTALATTTSTSTTTSTTSTTSTTTTTTTTTAPAGPGDVLGEPAGLFCRDLKARGYTYPEAVDYWSFHGTPDRMDADRNGIPCETVYPASDVAAYWGAADLPTMDALPSGLFCRDLKARGYSYAEAVAYWFWDGTPDRMDADLNGIPCETVYPASDVTAYWTG